ncbi:hypothetical protein [Wolbachia endosymbiont (group A) of Myopa testacea]|uniref:hypothetical protein n=1 Tax=Wolbachia endosymbiont (group A) of Myopa testacea TaxID=3066148 RepID=UPI0033416EA7
MLNSDNLRSIISALDNGSNLNKETKQKLKTLVKDILEVKAELKTEAKNELKT